MVPEVNICENPTLKGYSLLKEARVFRHTLFWHLIVA